MNLFSWASRPEGKEAPKEVFAGKPVAMMTASPGALGGIRAIPRLREVMADLDCITVPGFVTINGSGSAFNELGHLKSGATIEAITSLLDRLVKNTG